MLQCLQRPRELFDDRVDRRLQRVRQSVPVLVGQDQRRGLRRVVGAVRHGRGRVRVDVHQHPAHLAARRLGVDRVERQAERPGQRDGARQPRRRVGVQEYQMTAALWVRGILQDEYGVEAVLQPLEQSALRVVSGARDAVYWPRDAVRLGFRSSAGPFRSVGNLGFNPRPYQLVPLRVGTKTSR